MKKPRASSVGEELAMGRKSLLIMALVAVGLVMLPCSGSGQEKGAPYGLIAPFNTHVTVYDDWNVEPMRPDIFGTHGVVATGNTFATMAGIEVLRKGGNAFDAGVAAGMALKATCSDIAGWCGVAPLILYSARENLVITRTGAGTAPAAATLENYRRHNKNGPHGSIVPADVDVWLAALDRFGTYSFEQAAQYVLEVAENGYHLHHRQKYSIDQGAERIGKWPYNAGFWLQHGGGRQQLGNLMVNKDLGKLVRYMIDAERKSLAEGKSRSQGIQAARDAFYKGEPARAVDKFYKEFVDGQMTYEDMAGYQGRWDPPLHTTYRGYDIYACDTWSQGIRFIEILNILENFDLKRLGYNTPEYIHLLSQAINLAISDCHQYAGDPKFVDVPKELSSKEYARERMKVIDQSKAFQDMPPWGDPRALKSIHPDSPRSFVKDQPAAKVEPKFIDTTCLNIMDAQGNIFSITPSDGHLTTPLIPGWGFGLGNRGSQFNLDPSLANVVAPGKRPRNTCSPFVVMKDGKPFMGLSLAGSDAQAQALLQIFLNVVEWGMTPQQAMDHPRFRSFNFPETGQEVNRNPGLIYCEGRIPQETVKALEKLGHNVKCWKAWSYEAGDGTITYRDPQTGFFMAAADPRREMYALGY
ncbi:MAG: gamma-glutamyltransferase family protein [Candidatus Aminicenantales bacterium]